MNVRFEDVKLKALLKRIEECKGGRLESDLRALQATSRIYVMNGDELRKCLEDFTNPALVFSLWSDDNRELFDEYYREVIRLFHNFLASAKTLVDQMRVFIRRNYAQDEFSAEYKRKVKEVFGTSGLVEFVHGLRNYIVHVDLPPTRASLSGSPSQVRSAIYLDLAALHEWDGWSASANSYLKGLTSDPELLEVVNAYDALTESFYKWLDERIGQKHSADFEELKSLYAELRNYGKAPPVADAE